MKSAYRYVYSSPTTPHGVRYIKEARDAQDARRQALKILPPGATLTEIYQCPDHITIR